MNVQKLGKVIGLGIGFTLTLGSAAFADQCAYTTKQQAIAAVSRLEKGQTIYKLCEPCGDKVPRAVKINSVSAGTVGYENYWGVYVNEQNIDLAYTYIDTTSNRDRKVNLSILARCPAQNVSRFIFLSQYR